jgi:putative nucleotidyltransferase with HDIG domain
VKGGKTMEKLIREKAKRLLAETTTEPHLLRHALAVSAAMGAMARHYGADEEYWMAVGLLHDYDYEQHPDEHLRHTAAPLAAAGVDDEAIRAIMAHGWGLCSDVEPQTELEKSLFAVDELTGLISATARMRPGGIADLEPKSVKKKFKDKAFAAKIDRGVIQKGAEMLGLELGEMIAICIEGMRPCAAALGLLGTTH